MLVILGYLPPIVMLIGAIGYVTISRAELKNLALYMFICGLHVTLLGLAFSHDPKEGKKLHVWTE